MTDKILIDRGLVNRVRNVIGGMGFEDICEALRAALDQPVHPPQVTWEDPRVQAVYGILIDDEQPPAGSNEHWEGWQARRIVDALNAAPAQVQQHPDDIAVDRFVEAMKAKMAKQRAKGYGGWDDPADCPTERLQKMLADHLAKGDPVDVGNFAMMLFNRDEPTAAQKEQP